MIVEYSIALDGTAHQIQTFGGTVADLQTAMCAYGREFDRASSAFASAFLHSQIDYRIRKSLRSET